jgi:hypothetical protein
MRPCVLDWAARTELANVAPMNTAEIWANPLTKSAFTLGLAILVYSLRLALARGSSRPRRAEDEAASSYDRVGGWG